MFHEKNIAGTAVLTCPTEYTFATEENPPGNIPIHNNIEGKHFFQHQITFFK